MAEQRRVDDISRVFLARDVLLRISSAQLNARVAWIREHRALSLAEAREVARQRKQVSNREAARRGRQAHKQFVDALLQENERLRQQLAEYEALLVHRTQGSGTQSAMTCDVEGPPRALQFSLEMFDQDMSTLSF